MGAAIALSSLVGGIGYHSPSISGFKPRKERGSPLEEDERREGGFGMRNERERERGGLDDFGGKCGAQLIREWNKSRSKPRLSRG